MKERVDLHLHLDGKSNKENVIRALKKAEADGCKKICLLEHNNYVVDPILELIEDGSIKKYYTGDLVFGCEYDNLIDAHHINDDGTCYDNYVSHILVYLPYEDLVRILKNKKLHARDVRKDYIEDYKKIIQKIAEVDKNLPIPSIQELHSMDLGHIGRDLHKWINSDQERKALYQKTLQVESRVIDYPSDFIRNLMQHPNGKLFYKPENVLYSSELFEEIRKNTKNAKMVLAHPAYMQSTFTMENYVQTMMTFQNSLNVKGFDGMEVCYYLNTKKQQDYLEDYANKNNLLQTAGSDSIKIEGEMYFLRDNNKFFFVPIFGNALGTSYDIGNVEVTDKEDRKVLEVVRGGSPLVAEEDLFEDIIINEKEIRKQLVKKNCGREL